MCIACDCAMRRLLITPCASRCASSPVYVAGLVWTNHMPMHVMKLSLSIIDESAKSHQSREARSVKEVIYFR